MTSFTSLWRRLGGVLLVLLPVLGWGQQSLTGTAVTQDFNTLTSGAWADNTTLNGWYARTDATSSITSYIANTGTGTGALSAFGVAGTNTLSDRALGYAPTNTFTGTAGTGKGYIGWRLVNNTGTSITSFTVSYNGEQWRRDATTGQSLTFDYQTGTTVTSLTSGTYTAVSGLTFNSPTNTTAGAVDGNAAANRTALNATITLGAALPNGSEIMLRWVDLNDSGTDHLLAVDDVSVSYVLTAAAPTLTTNAATAATTAGTTFNATISSLGSPTASTDYGFLYSTTVNTTGTLVLPGNGTTIIKAQKGITGATATAYNVVQTGLAANTLYYVQAYAANSTGTGYGGVVSATTLAAVSSTTDASPGQTTANPGGTVAVGGAANITERGVYYSTTSGFADGAGTKVAASTPTGTGAFTSALSGLTANTPYYVKAYASNAGGTSYGAEVTFTTAPLSTNTITTGSVSGAPVCATSAASITVAYTTTGTITGTYSVELSDASGNFPGSTLTTTGGTAGSSITATVPAGTTSSTLYKVRVNNDAPATTGSASAAFTIISNTAVSVSGNTSQTLPGGSGTALAASSNSAVAPTYQWYYSNTANNNAGATAISGATSASYTPTAADLGGATGTYYVSVRANYPGCGAVVGTPEATIVVTPTPTINVNPTSLALGTVATNTPGVISTYTVSGSNLGSTHITITAPARVELSLNGFVTSSATTLSLTPSGGAVASTTVSVRISAGAATTISGNITNDAGSASQPVAVSGTVIAGTATTCINESFTSLNASASNLAAGFSGSNLSNYTSAGSSGAAPNAVQFGTNGAQLVTPTVSSPQQLSFYYKGNSVSGASALLVEGYDGSTYTTIENITSFPTTTGAAGNTKTYTTATGISSSFVSFRFTYTKVNGNVVFDDLVVSCGSTAPALTLATGTPSVAAPYCVGQNPAGDVSFNLPYTVSNGSFGTGNVFTAYLSDATGSFATNKKAVGSVTAVTSGTIPVVLSQFSTPFTLTTASAYRLRVEASTAATANPVLTDNGSNLAVTSYLDNKASTTALAGSGQATLSFTAPATCAQNVVVTIKQGASFGTKPTAAGTYTPGAGSGTVVYTTGTDIGGGQYVVYNGPATGSITVTGLSNGTQYTFGTFVTNGGSTGTTGYSDATQDAVRPAVPATLVEELLPRYIVGHAANGNVATTHTNRLPYAFRVTIGSLVPGNYYKYYNAAVDANASSTDGPTYVGVGSPIYPSASGSFVRQTTAALSSGNTFQADASGNYTGWFGLDPTGNERFEQGDLVKMRIVLNSGATTSVAAAADNTPQFYLTTPSTVAVRELGTGSTQATAVRGNSFGTAKNIVLTYDVETPTTERPLAATWVESDGTDASNYATFYSSSVNGTDGAYGLLTPNDNTNGIKRVEQRSLTTGLVVGCAATDADGTWPGTPANTTSTGPKSGTTALVLTTADTPFQPVTISSLGSSSIAQSQTLTITGSGFVAGPNPTVTFGGGATATAATVNAGGTSLTVVVPAAAQSGTVSVNGGCGSTATSAASLTIVPLVYYTKATGQLNALSTYGSNTDGTGTAPTAFTAANQTFVVSGTGRSFSPGDFTVSGTGAKVVLAANATFIIPTTGVFTGTLDQSAGSTLIIQNTSAAAITGISQGVQDATSTIDLAQSGAVYTVPTTLSYANLKLTNGSKRLPDVVVNGNLTLDNTIISGNVLNTSTSSAADYSTVQLFGDLNQLAGTTYDATRNITLQLMNLSAVQNLNGNGNTITLYRLYTASASGTGSGSNSAALGGRLTGSGSVLQVANSIDGGLALYESTASLALDAGTTLRFAPGGGGNFFVGTNGLLKPDPAANLEFYRNTANTYSLGTLRLASGFTTVNNFLLNSVAAGANTLTLTTDLTVNGTATLQAGTLTIGSNTLTLNGSLAVATGGFLEGSSTSNLTIGGSGAFGTLSFASGAQLLNNLTMNRNGGTLTLGAPLTVDNVLTLNNGIITTSAANLLTLTRTTSGTISGGSATSYVDGPLARATAATAATVLFPIGKVGAYRPLTLNTTSQSNTRIYTAEQFNSTARTTAINGASSGQPSATAALTRVSSVRYFTVTSSTNLGTYNGTVTLSFGADDFVNFPGDASFVVAKRATSSAAWGNFGRTGSSTSGGSGYVAGTLTSGTFTSFSDFSLASTAAASNNALNTVNPLPVALTSFQAQRQPMATAVALKWATASEKNSDYFEVQRSLNGETFATVTTVAAQGSRAKASYYTATDASASAGQLYYRLRQVDTDGTAAYSPVVVIAPLQSLSKSVALYPNPARESISFEVATATPYRVVNTLGHVLLQGATDAGTATISVTKLPVGTYFLELQTTSGRSLRKFVKE